MRIIGCLIVAACAAAATLTIERDSARAERAGVPITAAAAPSAGDISTGASEIELIRFAGGVIRVEFSPADFAVSRAELHEWVRQSARATAAYFGRFPVPYVRVSFEPTRGDEVTMGRAVGRPEPRIVVTMGRRTSVQELAHESLLVHEMVHLAIPDHDIRYLWLHEGIATYVENIARAQAGLVPAREMWGELMRELPIGLPEPRDASGLDGTRSDGRRYWGGALFCLLAEIEIRKSTGNRLGLQDALRALQRQGGNLSRLWTFERTLEVADRGTGTEALSVLYRQMGNRPHAPDLERLWRELGLSLDRGRVLLDDTAPLAAIRRAITERPSAPLLVATPKLLRVVNVRVQAAGP